MLCPRECGVNRQKGQIGVCGESGVLRAARADLHMWEEPCLSGQNGSGAVFFSGCNLHCVFCQNVNIASGDAGKSLTKERLAEIFLELQEKGADNINLVTAVHFVPQIMEALDLAKRAGLSLPVVYNSSGYEKAETIRMLDGYVDIYLPDFKYVSRTLSERYSHAPDYFERASEAIEEMVRQIKKMEFAPERGGAGGGILEKLDVKEYQQRSGLGQSLVMTRGVIVRHLLLPGCLEDSKKVVHYLLEHYGDKIFISLLNQYTPLSHAAEYPELMTKATPEEYEELVEYALDEGIENGFIQEGDAAQESFIPEFDGKGI